MKIKDRIVIITGGASGLGKAIAENLVGMGAKIVVLDINRKALDELKTKLPDVTVYSCDITDEKQISRTVHSIIDKYSDIDILINNAGILHSEPLFKLLDKEKRHSIENWKKVLDINLTAVFLMSSYAAEQMIMKRTKGLIINISSISAKGNEGQSAYSAAKAGVEALTTVWAKELGRYGIRSVAIAPGFMNTESTHAALSEQILEEVKEEILLKKLGDPHDIAKTVRSVIENDFINGTVINVNGGMFI